MKLLQYSCKTPKENIAIDEYLLQEVNIGAYSDGICRIWESNQVFVVMGLSKSLNQDVHEMACLRDGIDILKRCSGGGTVLQGPGCFNYSYILPLSYHQQLQSVSSTTAYVLSLVQATLASLIPNTQQKGISDLVINDLKFSGNAQRRIKHAVLFHGTILYNFDVSLITKYLKEPIDQPVYRHHRHHCDFIQNIGITKDQLISLFSAKTNGFIPISNIKIPKSFIDKVTFRSPN